jgi:transposase
MTITKEQIHTVTSVERRRRWSFEEKRSIIQEIFIPGMSLSHVAREYAMSPSQLFAWRRLIEADATLP